MTDLLEFIVGLNPRVQYPPEELDREPVVVIDQSTWEAIVDDARAALEAMQPDDDGGDMLAIAYLAGAHDPKRDGRPFTRQDAAKLLLEWSGDYMPDEARLPAVQGYLEHAGATSPAALNGAWFAALRAIAGEDQT